MRTRNQRARQDNITDIIQGWNQHNFMNSDQGLEEIYYNLLQSKDLDILKNCIEILTEYHSSEGTLELHFIHAVNNINDNYLSDAKNDFFEELAVNIEGRNYTPNQLDFILGALDAHGVCARDIDSVDDFLN